MVLVYADIATTSTTPLSTSRFSPPPPWPCALWVRCSGYGPTAGRGPKMVDVSFYSVIDFCVPAPNFTVLVILRLL